MDIKKGDIFLRDGNIYIVYRVTDIFVGMARLLRLVSGMTGVQTSAVSKHAVKEFFTKLTI